MAKNTVGRLSFNVAFCGIISAISVITMFGSLIPSLAYVVPAIAGIFIWTIGEQINIKWAVLSYITVAILSFMLVPELEANFFFISLFGYYPTLCEKIKRINKKSLQYVVKLLIFNISAVLTYKILCFILSADQLLEGMESFGRWAPYVLWGMGLVAFVLYDLVLETYKGIYIKGVKPKFKKLMK